jgi:DNA topoisomerase-2
LFATAKPATAADSTCSFNWCLLPVSLQTKETLTIKASSFGSKCELSTQLMDKVAKCGVMDNILSFAAFKNQKELKKSDGAKRSRLVGEF